MRTCVLAMIVLWSSLEGSLAAAQTMSEAELEQQLLAYINERMYNSCKSVILTRETGDVYEGFVRFANGRRRDVRVTVTDEKIEYEFVGRASSDAPEPKAESRTADSINRPAPMPDSQVTSANDHRFPFESYRKIEKGMSYGQVAGILGAPGTRISSSYFDGAVHEVWVWTNPDDSHICVVLSSGAVVIRTQSGLEQISPETGERPVEARDFDNWLLALPIDGRTVPLDLSFGYWLDRVREATSKGSAKPQIDIIEESNQIIVELSFGAVEAEQAATRLHLTCIPEEERLCVPVGLQVGDTRHNDPVRAWEFMATLANLSGK